MRYYRQLEVPNLAEIVSLARDFIQSDDSVFRRRAGVNLIHLREALVLNTVIRDCMSEHDLVCTGAFAFVMYNDHQCSIHSDSFFHETRLNIPIMNCEGTITKFYEVPEWRTVKNLAGSEVRIAADPRQCKVVDAVEIVHPTLLRVNTPHRVFLDSKRTPRVTLSLYFDRDPSFLLE